MFQVHGYYAHPDKAREVARFTSQNDYADFSGAEYVAQEWLTNGRYKFVTISQNGKRVGLVMTMTVGN